MKKDVTAIEYEGKLLRLFKRAVDFSINGMVITDITLPDMPIIYANKAFEKLTGYSKSEIIGRNCRFLQGADKDVQALMTIRQAIVDSKEVSVVLKNYRKDQTWFWNQLFLSPVPDQYGVVTHYIGIQTDITTQRNREQALAHSVLYDQLTGLPNRSLLRQILSNVFESGAAGKEILAIIYIDIDGFRLINYSFGYLAGDEVLKIIGLRLKELTGISFQVARLESDEFVIVIPGLHHLHLLNDFIMQIKRVVSAPISINDTEQQVTAGIGLSFIEDYRLEPMELVQQAELAMSRAKQLGKDKYQWYKTEMATTLNKNINLRIMLKKAILENEFELYFQPQVNAITGQLSGIEALLRWPHPEYGMIMPDEFIPVAEETGLIVEIGQWVITQSLADNLSLQQMGITPLPIAVNLSAIQFRHLAFIDNLEKILHASKLDPRWFELELTESLLLMDIEHVIAKLHRLKKLGISIAIDDFGTGFSSLNYLKRLPIDKLKIDRTFIRDLVIDKRDAAISKAIIAMAHQLDIKVIAEGVETQAQASFLAKHLCDALQGYLYAKPMPFDELKDFLVGYAPSYQEDSAQNQQTLLIVDDEENIIHTLKRVFRHEPYQVLTCNSAMEGLKLLALHKVQVIISDQRMPEMNGTEFLSRVKVMYPDTVRLVLSGYTDLRSVTDAINYGDISKFLTKPWKDEELKVEVRAAFHQYRKQQLESAKKDSDEL